MYTTKYHRPTTIEEALGHMAEADDAKFLSGGQTLIPTMKQRLAAPSDLIDLRHIPSMWGIQIEGRSITIGAATSHATVAASSELGALCPGICSLAAGIGDPAVRHMGTIGGSIANNDPAADYPAAILGLDATIRTSKREIAAADFFIGLFETALETDEIIVAVSFVAPDFSAYAKFGNPASHYAIAGVFVSRRGDDIRVTVTGAGSGGVFRMEEVESALADDWSPEAISNIVVSPDLMLSDMHGSADYRAHLVKAMAERAITRGLSSSDPL